MRNSALVSWLAAIAVSALWLTGCGGGTQAADIYAPLPTLEPVEATDDEALFAVQPVAEVDAPAAPVKMTAPDVESVAAFHEAFLARQSAVVVGYESVESLDAIAMPKVIDTTAEYLAVNEQLTAEGNSLARNEIHSFSRVLDVKPLNDKHFAFTSCTEEQSWFLDSDDWAVRFIDEAVTIWDSPTGWKVASIEVRHDGRAGSVGLTCAPPTFVERADLGAQAGIAEVQQALADPETAQATGFSPALGGKIEEELGQIIAAQIQTGFSRVSGQEYRLEVLGIDPSQSDFVVVVAMCSHYPNGVVNRSSDTGEVTVVDAFPPGHSEMDWVYVWLEPVKWGEAALVGIEPGKSTDCWEQ